MPIGPYLIAAAFASTCYSTLLAFDQMEAFDKANYKTTTLKVIAVIGRVMKILGTFAAGLLIGGVSAVHFQAVCNPGAIPTWALNTWTVIGCGALVGGHILRMLGTFLEKFAHQHTKDSSDSLQSLTVAWNGLCWTR